MRSRRKNLGQIRDGMPAHREGKTGLSGTCPLGASDEKRRRIKDSRKRTQPGLIVVLRAKVADHGIRDVALENLRCGALPVAEESLECIKTDRSRVTLEQFSCCGRRTRARIEKHDIRFAAREGLVDDGQIAKHHREKAKAEATF